jgi:hypothetical protein
MRIALGFCVLLCLVILGFGIHFVLQEQRQVMSFSATTTAVVLTKQIQKHEYENLDPGDSTCAFEPVVTYRYEAHGQPFTSNRVFPASFQAGGIKPEDIDAELGRAMMKVLKGVETPSPHRFDIEPTTAAETSAETSGTDPNSIGGNTRLVCTRTDLEGWNHVNKLDSQIEEEREGGICRWSTASTSLSCDWPFDRFARPLSAVQWEQ